MVFLLLVFSEGSRYNEGMKELILGDYELAKEHLDSRLAKAREEGYKIIFYDLDSLSLENLESEIPLTRDLFGERSVFVFRDASRLSFFKELICQSAESENHFLFLEQKLLKKDRDFFEKKGFSLFDFQEKKEKKEFNIFRLADSFGRRDKKQLWLDYHEALVHARPEEIHGVLFWQLKNLALVQWDGGKSLKPFVLKKNSLYAKNFSEDDIERLSHLFIQIFHERKTNSTLAFELEKMILDL